MDSVVTCVNGESVLVLQRLDRSQQGPVNEATPLDPSANLARPTEHGHGWTRDGTQTIQVR
jgi:hypothetical protein